MWIANKAAEALNSAKKGISEMAKEMPTDSSTEKTQDQNMKTLQRNNLLLRRKLEQMTEEISNYKDIIEKMLKEKPDLINFKIIIGRQPDDPEIDAVQAPLMTDELESARCELQKLTQSQNSLVLSLAQSQQDLAQLKQSSEAESKALKNNFENLKVQNSDLCSKLSALESSLSTSSDSLNKYRSRVQKSISDIFLTLKPSFESLGLALPSIKLEQLGLEDIQEFIFTQCKYYEDSLNAFRATAKSIGKEGRTLDDFRKIFQSTINDCKNSIKASEKLVQESDQKLQKVLKEKEEIFKINTKKDKRIEVLIEEIGKNSEELKICQELKDENPRLAQQVKELHKEVEKFKENLKNSKESQERIEKKVLKKKEKIAKLNQTTANLNKRVKALGQTLTEKDQLLSSFQEATGILNSELSELKSTSDQYKVTSKKNLEEVTAQFAAKLKETEEKSANKQKDLEKRMKDLQNEAKDLRVENIQLVNKVKKLEELEKNLGCLSQQNSMNLGRIDRLTIDKEKTAAALREAEETLKSLRSELVDAKELLASRSQSFETEKEGLLLKIRENEHIKQEADALLRRIEQETLANEKMIDKRVVSTFLLSYTSDKYSAKAKAQMLVALAEMLGMPNEERNPANPSNSLFQQSGQQGGLFTQPAQGAGLFSQTAGQGSLFGTNPNPGGQPTGGLFGTQTGGSSGAPGGSSLFAAPATNTNQPSSLFGANSGGSLFSNQGTSNSASLFASNPGGTQGPPQAGPAMTGGLFGNAGNPNPAGNPSGGLFGSNTATPSFGNQAASTTGGLFGSGTSVGTGSQPTGTPGSLFGTGGSAGGLFGNQGASTTGGLLGSGTSAGQPGGLFGNPSQGGGLFSSNTGQGGSLFGQTGNPSSGGLFGGNTGGLFGQSSAFNTPATPSFGGQGSGPLFSGAGQGSSNIAFVPYQNFSDKTIESLAQIEKENLFELSNQIELNESHLKQVENTLNKISKFKDDIKARLQELFTFARKVQTGEKRCKASLEIVKKFQGNISLFIKDAVKVFDRCERADGFNQIDSPGVFLTDMLANCEERLKSIEESFKEIQELVLIEDRSNEFILLVKTIAMMQTKFELVSSLTLDMHKRVLDVTNRYSMTFGIDFEETSTKDVKIKEINKSFKASSLADLIAARPGSMSYRFP